MLQVFQLFRTYVISVSYDVLKVDQDAPHVAMCPTCHNLLLKLLGHRACVWGTEGDGGSGVGGPACVREARKA
jgi:hypothetical protein